jgi:hypothetical protein
LREADRPEEPIVSRVESFFASFPKEDLFQSSRTIVRVVIFNKERNIRQCSEKRFLGDADGFFLGKTL